MINSNFPKQFTQGDRIFWSEIVEISDNTTDLLSCFLRGGTALDLTGLGDLAGRNQWNFAILEAQSALLIPGIYEAQFVLYGAGFGRKTLATKKMVVCPSFESLSSLDTRTSEEKELEELEKAIAQLSNGVAEYYIGTRRVRYAELGSLYERQKYLKNRIAKMKNPGIIGGRNVEIRF